MNKAEARVVLGLVKEAEFKLARIRAMAELSASGNERQISQDLQILQMDAKEFFVGTQVPFSTNRVLKWLEARNVKTVEQVTQYTGEYLSRCRNLGPISIRYIEKCLARHGLHLKDISEP